VGLAATGWPSIGLMILFTLGAVVMRGAGCVVNDICDRRLDAAVARTQDRPLASGALGLWQALLFLALLLAIGLALLLVLNRFTVGLGVASLALVALYPAMKRVTWCPQLFLGVTFNWGVLMGWSAATGTLGLPAIPLYLAGVFWTLGYDTIYAWQDVRDDEIVGIKSTARLFGTATLPWVALFYAGSLFFLACAGFAAGLGGVFYKILLVAALFAAVQLALWRMNEPANCQRRFEANAVFGLLVFAAIVSGKIL